MMERSGQANIEQLIVSTVTMLCKNSISYSSELHIQGTIGITVDASSVILVHLNQRFECGAEDTRRSASAHNGRGAVRAADSIQTNTCSLANAKRPRMTLSVHSSRRPVVRTSVRPVRRVRSGHDAVGVMGSAQRPRQQLALPRPSKMAFMTPRGAIPHTAVQRLTPSLSTSRRYHTGHVASSVVSSDDTPQPLLAKREVESVEQSAGKMTRCPITSDVICVESDDETESAEAMKPRAVTSRMNSVSVKSEEQSLDALQMIVDRAVVAARASNTGMVSKPLMLFYMVLSCIKFHFVISTGK